MLKEGDVLKDRYKVTQLIGKGGMSSVYLATDINLSNKLWAIKEVSRKAKDQAGRPIEQSLVTEASLLSKLDHPMIVNISNIITTDKYIYVVMDYVEGKSLDKVVREEGPQKEEDVQNWMIQICDALDYLHKQDPPIIYRDMKPSNIMLRPDGYVKLIDLGVAREYKDTSKKDTISFGTEGYAPPEQYGKAQTDPRADIYALGATMWHLLTGEAPQEYPLPDIRTKNTNVGEGFSRVIVPKCCQLERELRYQNCEELVADLEVYEELTQEYFDEQKKKVNTFMRLAVGGLACILAGFIFIGIGSLVVTQNYNSQMTLAATASDPAVAEAAYKEAISYKPGDSEPYLKLLQFYQERTGQGNSEMPIFTAEKFNAMHELLEKYDGDLKRGGAFADVYYEVGKAIWDNYDDGSNNTDVLIRDTAISKAKPFFQAASDNTRNSAVKDNSDMYVTIAEFNDKIRNFKDDNDRATSDVKNTIEEYTFSLEKLLDNLEYTTSNKVKLNAYAVIQSALNSSANDFHSAGISKNRLENLGSSSNRGLSALSFENPIYKQAKDKCLASLSIAMSRVERAYSNSSVGGK